MDERDYFAMPVSSKSDVTEVVLEALYTVYEVPHFMQEKTSVAWFVQQKTNFLEQDVDEVIDKMFDRMYLRQVGSKVVFGVVGLWLLEDACMNDVYELEPNQIAEKILEKDRFF